MCHGVNYTFSGLISGVFTIFFCPGIGDSRLSRCYLDVKMLSVPTVPPTRKAITFCVIKLQVKQDKNDLISLQMFQLYFSY